MVVLKVAMNKSEDHLPLAEFLPGRFQLVRELGRGGMGQVFLGKDLPLDRLVAVKFPHRDQPGVIDHLIREARSQASIHHPNVIHVHEIGMMNGKPCIIMDFIDGETLWEALPRMVMIERLRLFRQICGGVHAAHEVGLVHRDLSPSNVLVQHVEGAGWKAFVSDFGLASGSDGIPGAQGRGCVGTLDFMSPEQLQGHEGTGVRSDIYALGAILYTLVLECPPLRIGGKVLSLLSDPYEPCSEPILIGKTEETVQDASIDRARGVVRPPGILELEIKRPRSINPKIQRDLETIIMHAMNIEPEDRYISARALEDEIQRFIENKPIHARRRGVIDITYKLIKRNIATFAVLFLLLLSVSIAIATVHRVRNQGKQDSELARKVTARALEIQNRIRLSSLIVGPEREREVEWVKSQIKTLEDMSIRDDDPSSAPHLFLRGFINLRLENHQRARVDLEKAWNHGFQDPNIAQALGEAIFRSWLFERARNRMAYEINDQGDINKSISLLRSGKDGSIKDPLAIARIRMLEGDELGAINAAMEAIKSSPWLFEAHIFIGNILGLAMIKQNTPNEMMEVHNRALEAYDAAIRLAPGSVQGLMSKARQLKWYSMRQRQKFSRHHTSDLLDAIMLCDMAVDLDPSYPGAYALRSDCRSTLMNMDPYRSNSLANKILIELMLSDAKKGLELAPDAYPSVAAMAWALEALTAVGWTLRDQMDASQELDTSIASLEKLCHQHPNHHGAHRALGFMLRTKARVVREAGGDPRPWQRRSIDLFMHGIKVMNLQAVMLGERLPAIFRPAEGMLMLAECELEYGQYDSAKVEVRRAFNLMAEESAFVHEARNLQANIAWGHLILAEIQARTGQDATKDLQNAYAAHPSFLQSLSRDPYVRLERDMRFEAQRIKVLSAIATRTRAENLFLALWRELERHLEKAPRDHAAAHAMMRTALIGLSDPRLRSALAPRERRNMVRWAEQFERQEATWWPDEPRTRFGRFVLRYSLALDEKSSSGVEAALLDWSNQNKSSATGFSSMRMLSKPDSRFSQ